MVKLTKDVERHLKVLGLLPAPAPELSPEESDLVEVGELQMPKDEKMPFAIPETTQAAVQLAPGVWVPPNADLRWRTPRPPRDWVIEGVMPAGFVHLMAGASGTGKTTLIFQLIEALNGGGEFLGYKVKSREWAYITADRPEDSVQMTQERMNLEFPIFSLVDQGLMGKSLVDVIIPRLTSFYGYKPKFIYVDGFTGMAPDGNANNYFPVAMWLAGLQRYCNKMGITLLGAVHCAKAREGQAFTKPREKILGTAAWGAFTETVLVLETEERGDKKDDAKRICYVLPRNGASDTLILHFDENGRLTMAPQHIEGEEAADFIMSTILPEVTLTPNRCIDYKELWMQAEKKGVNHRTFDRWLARLVDQSKLRKKGKGVYVVPEEYEAKVEELQPAPSLTHL